jgi:hypothetical protein
VTLPPLFLDVTATGFSLAYFHPELDTQNSILVYLVLETESKVQDTGVSVVATARLQYC